MNEVHRCEVAVVGAGLGGVAAALAAADAGLRVVLTEPTDRVGGQATSQGVGALDEHWFIEDFGATRSYRQLREGVRASYAERYGVPITAADGTRLNPGGAWAGRLSFEPQAAKWVLDAMLAEHVASGAITLLLHHSPIRARREGDRIASVTLQGPGRATVDVEAQVWCEASELGDLLPLADVPYRVGVESRRQTDEPGAPRRAEPGQTQSFTFPFAVEHRPGEDHTVERPDGYARFRDTQPFSLTITDPQGNPSTYRVFSEGPTGTRPFWTYRRLRDGAALDPSGATPDVTLVNWDANDYRGGSLIDVTLRQRDDALDEARRLSLSFLHWLQTEVPRDDGSGHGYPGLKLVPEAMGTPDGLSAAPYVRESRRIVALTTIREQDLVLRRGGPARATLYDDTVGVGWYPIDVHSAVGRPTSRFEEARPFQIPLGALLSPEVTNLVASGKCLGTTHITNGAYRLHPVEWAVGEAAGAVAAAAVRTGRTPHEIRADHDALRGCQLSLLEREAPLYWFLDIGPEKDVFRDVQILAVAGAVTEDSPLWHPLPEDLGRPIGWPELITDYEHEVSGAEAADLLTAARRLAAGGVLERGEIKTLKPLRRAARADVAGIAAAAGALSVPLDALPDARWGSLVRALGPAVSQACEALRA